MPLNAFWYGCDDAKVSALQILSIENRGANVFVNFSAVYRDGTDKLVRTEARKLPCRYEESSLAAVICVGRVNCNFLKSDHRLLFHVTLKDGVQQLLQEKEGTPECNRLLRFEQCPPQAKTGQSTMERERVKLLQPLLSRWDPLCRKTPDGSADYTAEAEQLARLVTARDDANEIAALLFTVLRGAAEPGTPVPGPALKSCAAPAFEVWSALDQQHGNGQA